MFIITYIDPGTIDTYDGDIRPLCVVLERGDPQKAAVWHNVADAERVCCMMAAEYPRVTYKVQRIS